MGGLRMSNEQGLLLDLPARMAPGHTALLVVDMQNDFCGAGGYIDKVIGKDPAACSAVAVQVNRLVDAARARGVPVLWLRANYANAGLPESMRAKLAERKIHDGCCAPGTGGYEWHGVQPAPDEPVLDKTCYDGFVATPLESELHKKGIRSIVFAGVQTNVCVEATLRHAHALGFYCVVPQDCVASHTPPAHEATLNNVRFLFGDVTTLDDVVKAWAPAK